MRQLSRALLALSSAALICASAPAPASLVSAQAPTQAAHAAPQSKSAPATRARS